MLHILTLTWNAADKLTALKESLFPALAGIDYKWHIKDNGSKDNTVAVASTWGDTVDLIAYKDNRQNFSEGMNYLFAHTNAADTDQILLLNNDIVFNDTTSIRNMQGVMRYSSEVGVVGARLLFNGTDKLQHAGVVFDPTYRTPMHFRAGETSDANAQKNRQFQVVTGAVLLTTAGLYKQVCTTNKSGLPGMDENYHWAFDDVDFCLAVKYNLQKKIIYCGETNIFHEESASLKKNPVNKLFLNHNLQYLFKKWGTTYQIDKDIYTQDPKHNLF